MKKIEIELEDYLRYFDVGVKDYVIAAVYGMSISCLKGKKKSWGFGRIEAIERRISIYKKWKSFGYIDKDIAKLMGIRPSSLYEFKMIHGLSGKRRSKPKKVVGLY